MITKTKTFGRGKHTEETTKWFREVVQEILTKTFIFLGFTFPIKPC